MIRFLFGEAYFQGLLLLVLGRVLGKNLKLALIFIYKFSIQILVASIHGTGSRNAGATEQVQAQYEYG